VKPLESIWLLKISLTISLLFYNILRLDFQTVFVPLFIYLLLAQKIGSELTRIKEEKEEKEFVTSIDFRHITMKLSANKRTS
jgi:hypothetical protein